jgi:hypothetical protein
MTVFGGMAEIGTGGKACHGFSPLSLKAARVKFWRDYDQPA